jgi:hypothetical protein
MSGSLHSDGPNYCEAKGRFVFKITVNVSKYGLMSVKYGLKYFNCNEYDSNKRDNNKPIVA